MEKQNGFVKKALIGILAVLVISAAGVGFVFRNEIKTANSIQKVDDHFYVMTYHGDYGFDDFLNVGASNDAELVEFVSRQILKGFAIEMKTPDLSCSTFNAVTPDGDRVFGRNFDYESIVMLVYTKPDKGYRSVSMVNLAFIDGYREGGNIVEALWSKGLAMSAPYLPLDGINEKGLAVGILQLFDPPTRQETGKVAITSTTAIRLLLDKAATVDEAVALLQKYDMCSSANSCYHYQITDAAGNSVIVEYVDNEMQVLKPDGKYQAATNFYLTPGRKFNIGDGHDRYQIILNRLRETNGIMTTREGIDLLAKARMHNVKDPQTGAICNTSWSALYNNTKKTVDLAVWQKYDKVYHYTVDE
ncbi:MAG: C45 family peptidase [Thermodesulfobacteriota bacterium]